MYVKKIRTKNYHFIFRFWHWQVTPIYRPWSHKLVDGYMFEWFRFTLIAGKIRNVSVGIES